MIFDREFRYPFFHMTAGFRDHSRDLFLGNMVSMDRAFLIWVGNLFIKKSPKTMFSGKFINNKVAQQHKSSDLQLNDFAQNFRKRHKLLESLI